MSGKTTKAYKQMEHTWMLSMIMFIVGTHSFKCVQRRKDLNLYEQHEVQISELSYRMRLYWVPVGNTMWAVH